MVVKQIEGSLQDFVRRARLRSGDHPVCAVCMPALFLIIFLACFSFCAAAENVTEQQAPAESELFVADDPEILSAEELSAEEELPAGEETDGKRRAGRTVDGGGLIEDPEGNASIDDIAFEITDDWAREEIEQEEAALVSYGRLYPPAPLLAGINSFRQGDMRWGLHSYGYANAAGTVPATISSSGCGLLALVNAVYYMTGRFIEPAQLADWCIANGYRMNGVGTVHAMYQAYAGAYGEKYGFTYAGTASSLSQINAFLQNEGTAIISTPHHLMAVVDYDPAKGGYLLLDSAPSYWRGTYPTGYCYHSLQDFQTDIPIYAIMLLRRTAEKKRMPEGGPSEDLLTIPCVSLESNDFFDYIRECYLRDQLYPVA